MQRKSIYNPVETPQQFARSEITYIYSNSVLFAPCAQISVRADVLSQNNDCTWE